jgi:flagellar hook-associated protein 3 FlgL
MIKPTRQSLAFRTERSKARISSTKAEMAKAEETAISGLKVRRASDDPSRWPEINALQSALDDQKGYLGNVNRVESLLNAADKSLGSATKLVTRAREMAIQLTNEIYTGVDRAAAANEIDTLRSQLIEVANTQMNGRFLFAGTAYDEQAFDDAGAYLGNTDEPEAKIGNNATLRTGWDGTQVFQGAVDVFQVLDDLSTAFAADDIVAIRDTLVGLDGGLEQVIAWRSEIGFGQAAAGDARDIATHMEQLLTERKSEAVEEDPAAAFTKLAELRVAYETSLQVTAATSRSKLFDFIQ